MFVLADITLPWGTLVMLMLLPVGVGLCALAVYLFRQRRLVLDMLLLADDLSHGRTERRADPTHPGRLGDLARSMNQLAARLEAQQTHHREVRDHLQALLDYTEEAVLATDEDDLVRLLNPAAAKFFDRPREQIFNRPIHETLTYPDLLALYHAAYGSSTPVSRQIRLPLARKTIQCHVTASTIYSGAQYRGTLLILHDLTEVAQAFQMKTDFVTNASHELRTPLASIRAAVETLQEPAEEGVDPILEDPVMVRKCLEIIANNVLRLQMMVQDLLDLARTEDPRAVVRSEVVDLQHVCDLILGMYGAVVAEKRIAMHVNLEAGAHYMKADERLLVLILKNLVDNSLKFTPVGGRVTLHSYIEEATGGVILEVRDTGCGISPEDQQRVFERFYTVNRSRGGADRGTGLGLAIVKHALTALGGTIQLESELEKGTTMRCLFPPSAVVRQPARPLARRG